MFYNDQEAKNWHEGTSMYRGYSVYRFKIIWPEVHPKTPKNTLKTPQKLKFSKYVVWGLYGKVWSRIKFKLYSICIYKKYNEKNVKGKEKWENKMPEKERIRSMGQTESVGPEKRKDRNTTK